MRFVKTLLLLVVIGGLCSVAFIYFGLFNAAADVPHSQLVYNLMETVRQRSIAVRAKDIVVPPLDDPKLVADGAGHYSAMCTGCHLAPGMAESEIRPGLYPQPPNLSEHLRATPAEMFWTIKHGIKMSAMPAWGTTHDDQAIWGIVAFLKKLPAMTPEQYQAMTKPSGEGEAGHDHHHGEGDAAAGHDHAEAGAAHQHHSQAAADDEHARDHAASAAHTAEAPLSLADLKEKAVPDAEQTAVAFHQALQHGDRDAVLALLSNKVTVSEAGQTQSLGEYAAGHLGEDIAYLKDAQIKTVSLASMLMGESAMVGSESEIRKTVNGQSKVQRSREMLTLERENRTWKIVAIQWQSAPGGE